MNQSRKLAYWAVMLLGCYGIVSVFRVDHAFPAIAAVPTIGFMGGLVSGLFLFGLPALAAPVFRPDGRAGDTIFGAAVRAPRVFHALSVASGIVMTAWGAWALVAEWLLPTASTPTLAVTAVAAAVIGLVLTVHVARARTPELVTT